MNLRKLQEPLVDQDGMALILTVLILSILIVLVFEVNSLTRFEMLGAAHLRDETQAGLLARSGVQEAIRILKKDDAQVDDNEEEWAKANSLPVDISDGKLSFAIRDESGKFNVNRLIKQGTGAGTAGPQQTKAMDEGQIQAFLRLLDPLGIERNMADPLLDWLDADDEPRASGAESDYYMTQDSPYRAKNGPLDALSELKRLKGYEESVFAALMGRDEGSRSKSPLSSLLTLYSTGRININTAPAPVLRSLASEITDDVAAEILKARQERPFPSIPDIKRVPGITEAVYRKIEGLIDIKSATFSVQSTGEVRGVSRTVWVALRREQDRMRVLSWQED